MRYLIDANCVIYLFAGTYPRLGERVRATDQNEIGLSAIVFAELSHGSAHGKPPTAEALDKLLRQMPLVDFDEAAARSYATTPFKRGRFDRLLAGHALSLGVPIITRNSKDFRSIPGLHVEDWTK